MRSAREARTAGGCAAASHFMASYGLVIDRGMLTNVLQTDPL